MELTVKPYSQGVIEWNYEELKQALIEKIGTYENLVYTEDDIKAAKADRADLNKLKKSLNDKRISLQKEWMKPFDSFKGQIDELIALIEKPVGIIDAQIKEHETKVKDAKASEIKALFDSKNTFVWLTLEKILDPKWLNASTSMESISEAMDFQLRAIEVELATLKGMEYEFEITEYYKEHLSLAGAMAEMKRLKDLAAKKAEVEKVMTESKPVSEEPREWMELKVKINSDDFDALQAWLEGRHIEWEIK